MNDRLEQDLAAKQDKKQGVSFVTLGCKVNQAESQALGQLFGNHGYKVVELEDDPDVIVVNTCSVTAAGSGKSRKQIRKIAKEHPDSILAVMGCYSQLNPQEIAEIEGVDIVLGTQNRMSVIEELQKIELKDNPDKKISVKVNVGNYEENFSYEELPLVQKENKARAMVKIQDGCSQYCTYCIIPYARGPSRSRKPEHVLGEVKNLINSGYKEIVLTGIHIGAYGHDLDEKVDLAKLASSLDQLPGIKRLRLGSVESMEFTEDLIKVITSSANICPHFHIPLQSGCNRILEEMGRPYTTEDFSNLLEKIRKKLPDAAITTDVMVGFPGETEDDHKQAVEFIRSCRFFDIHVFPYSRREGTPAADMPKQVANKEKAKRVKDILEIKQKSKEDYLKKFIDKKAAVLLEKVEQESAKGHTDNYIEVEIPLTPEYSQDIWRSGEIVECVLRQEYIVY